MAGGDRVGDASIVEVLSKEACKEETKEQKEGRARKEVGLHHAGGNEGEGRGKTKKKKSRIICSNFRSYFPIQIRAFQPPFASGSLTPGMKILPFFCSGGRQDPGVCAPSHQETVCTCVSPVNRSPRLPCCQPRPYQSTGFAAQVSWEAAKLLHKRRSPQVLLLRNSKDDE